MAGPVLVDPIYLCVLRMQDAYISTSYQQQVGGGTPNGSTPHPHSLPGPPTTMQDHTDDDTHVPLPPYLARHAKLGFNSDDVDALIRSIDSSQTVPPTATATAPAQLPAEIILEIVEHVPIDYILDWRLVARGIRDAIDGRILHHHLQRAELIGYLGTRSTGAMPLVGDSHYERLSLMRARFGHMQDCVDDDGNNNHNSDNDQDDGPRRVPPRKAIWACLHAVFRIEEDWLQAFGDACRRLSEKQTMAGVAALWEYIQQRLEWPRADQGLWAVRWCLRLDHAVLDLGLPLDAGKHCGTLDLDLQQGTVRIAWYDLLRDFLKSESAFRRLFAKARVGKKTPPGPLVPPGC